MEPKGSSYSFIASKTICVSEDEEVTMNGVSVLDEDCNKRFIDCLKEILIKFAQENCVKKIVRNGPATIVFWDDGTKTIVKRAEGTKDDIYMAFCSAFTKKMLGTNSRIKRIIFNNLIEEGEKKNV